MLMFSLMYVYGLPFLCNSQLMQIKTIVHVFFLCLCLEVSSAVASGYNFYLRVTSYAPTPEVGYALVDI